jgi:hypothetical protein|tara:strand:+ start:193 stop:564 length:372 start_codon:yes stop_codon:yes gene_type:complete
MASRIQFPYNGTTTAVSPDNAHTTLSLNVDGAYAVTSASGNLTVHYEDTMGAGKSLSVLLDYVGSTALVSDAARLMSLIKTVQQQPSSCPIFKLTNDIPSASTPANFRLEKDTPFSAILGDAV